jgi:hypothetical protein
MGGMESEHIATFAGPPPTPASPAVHRDATGYIADQKALLPAIVSGRVSASLSAATERACSRSKTASGNCGRLRMARSRSIAGRSLSAIDSVRRRSRSAIEVDPTRQLAPRSAIRLAICVSSIPPAPSSSSVAGQGSDTRLALAFISRAGSKIDLNVDDRQRVILDEENARAGRPSASARSSGRRASVIVTSSRQKQSSKHWQGFIDGASMAGGKRRARARDRQGLRVEFGHRQLLVAKIFLAPPPEPARQSPPAVSRSDAPVLGVGMPCRFQLANLHGLRKHRIELVDLAGNQLRLGARKFIRAHAVS